MKEMTLEDAVNAHARELLSYSWRKYSNNQALALRLGELAKLLRRAGLPWEYMEQEWNSRYEKYRQSGGRAPYREMAGYNW